VIMPNEVGTVRQLRVVTFVEVGSLVVTLEHSIGTTQRTLWNSKVKLDFRETLISIFGICVYNKLNKFNEGNLVFADVCFHPCPRWI